MERIERRISDLKDELAELYGESGSTPTTSPRRQGSSNNGEEARERERQAAAAEEAAAGLTTALGSLTMAELEAEHEAAMARTRAHIQQHGELTVDLAPGQLADRQAELRGDASRPRHRLANLRAQIRDRENRLPDAPALREEAERLELEIGELDESARAIAIARDALERRRERPTGPSDPD